MINNELVIKCYVLLYLESSIVPKVTDSKELVKQVLGKLDTRTRNKTYLSNPENDPGVRLMEHISRLINNEETEVGYEYVVSTINLIYGNDNTLNTIKHLIDPKNPLETIKSNILGIRGYLTNIVQRDSVQDAIRMAYREILSNNPSNSGSTSSIAQDLITKLEGVASASNGVDPAIISKVCFENKDTIKQAILTSVEEQGGNRILKLGWEGLNEMTQGGIRLGTFTSVVALQHGYKSGMGRTIFAQVASCNDAPVIENKKPLLLYISFEDAIHYSTNFMYEYFKYAETGEEVDLSSIDPDHVTEYLYNKLTERGWYVDMIHVNPSEWGYRDILNLILEYEVEGYEVVMLLTDYLSKLSTIGCDKSGAMGTDYQDMFRRVRNAINSKDIAFVTPHQLNTEAKSLWSSGLKGHDLLDSIVGGGYYAKSKQLDVEIDLELYLALEKRGDDTYLCIQRGKHRGAQIIPERKKKYILPFPKSSPIPPDGKNGEVLGGNSYSDISKKTLSGI